MTAFERLENIICGADEAGAGTLSGSVFAAAVILDPEKPIDGLNDSKKLTAKKREKLAAEIKEKSIAWCITFSTVQQITETDILQSRLDAMKRAVEGLSIRPNKALIDGNRCPNMDIPAEAIVGGDAKEACISAASILAKTAKDAEAMELHSLFPQYGFDKHKGYGTEVHMKALLEHGPAPCHRTTFGPVANLLNSLF